jgi:hypothetical protein
MAKYITKLRLRLVKTGTSRAVIIPRSVRRGWPETDFVDVIIEPVRSGDKERV